MNERFDLQKEKKGYAVLFTMADSPGYLVFWGLPFQESNVIKPKRLAVRPHLFPTAEKAQKAFQGRREYNHLLFFKTVHIDLTLEEGSLE